MTLDDMKQMHKEFIALPHRRPQTCIEPIGMKYLWDKLEELKPETILDLGSGLSSWVIRTWSKDKENVQVISTDLEAKWLNFCVNELQARELSIENMFLHEVWEESVKTSRKKYDFIFLDLGDTRARKRRGAVLAGKLKKKGLMVLDDWHMPHYNGEMRDILESAGMTVVDHKETIDRYGRYVAEAYFQ